MLWCLVKQRDEFNLTSTFTLQIKLLYRATAQLRQHLQLSNTPWRQMR